MNQHLLMIEDDVRLAHMVAEYLRQSGYQVEHAADAQTGLSVLRTTTPHLVVLDLMLPDMDGLEVCRRIRAMAGPAGQRPHSDAHCQR
jgi:DNA-binding response OmpR family regulator